jgi:hypothetical protein
MRSAAIAVCLVLAGCAEPVHLTARFNPAEVAWFSAAGTNTLGGTAIIRSDNGGAKTCAALEVMLIPVSAYASERMRALYGSDREGFNPILLGRPADFGGDDPGYLAAARSTRCDARGRFSFTGLPDGDYFVVAVVTWRERRGGLVEGGYLMQRVQLATGEAKDVLLAH